MQSTILFLQQELKNTKERIQILEKENYQLKTGTAEVDGNNVCDDQQHSLHDIDNNEEGNSYKLEDNSMTNLTQSDENSTLMEENRSNSATPMDCSMSHTLIAAKTMTTAMESTSTRNLTTNTINSLQNASVDGTIEAGVNSGCSSIVNTIKEPMSLAEISTNNEESDNINRLSTVKCRIESDNVVASAEQVDNNSAFLSNTVNSGLYNGLREGTTTETTASANFKEDGSQILATPTMSNELVSSITAPMGMITNDSELRSTVPMNEISIATESLPISSSSTLNYCATGHKMRTLTPRKRTYDGEMVTASESMQPINMVSAPRTLPPKKSKLRVADINSSRTDGIQLLQDNADNQITMSSLMCNANSNENTAMVSSISMSEGGGGDNDVGNMGANVAAQQNIYLPSNNNNSANNTTNNNVLMESSTSPAVSMIGSGSDGNELTGTMGGMSPRILSRRRSVRLNGIGSNGGGITDNNNTY